MNLTHGSLFSGIGGFELGAAKSGIPTLWNCEIEDFNRKVLKKNFPASEQFTDITKLKNPPYVDIISGGFPCQDISIANGKAKGIKGKRSGLWGEMWRIIREVRPFYVVIENSPILLNRGFDKVLCDLSEIGYNAEWECLSAEMFGAKHKRERLFVIAYPYSCFLATVGSIFKKIQWDEFKEFRSKDGYSFELDTTRMVFTYNERDYKGQNTITKPLLCGKADAVSCQLDRLESLGNAVVPEIAHYLFECIKSHHQQLQYELHR